MRKSRVHGLVLTAISVCLTLLGLEFAVRLQRGTVLQLQSQSAQPQNSIGRNTYHPRLGWITRPGRFESGWISNTDESGIRSNGRPGPPAGRPVLAVGDSFTFGDEVEDGETWAAQLEEILNKSVINAGVGAYGIDQAFLRAELLLEKYDPEVVILSFISDDINRTEYSCFPNGRGWKPYFAYEQGALALKNVPVPRDSFLRRHQTLHRLLGYSALVDFVLNKIAYHWWHNIPVIERIHQDGEKVSADLLVRLDSLAKSRGGQFIAVALATNGRIGDNLRLPGLVKRAREEGVVVLDLSVEMLQLPPGEFQKLFQLRGHYSPAMNIWVAGRIAAFLHERGIHSPAGQPRTVP